MVARIDTLIASILNPLVAKFSEENPQKDKKSENEVASWLTEAYEVTMSLVKGCHMMKGRVAFEWNQLFM